MGDGRESTIPSTDFLRALARGKPVYDLATLERYVDDDLALLRAVKPAVVIGDFRISLAVSARLSGVPYINIANAYWSPYARPRWHAPTMPWSRHVSAALDDWVFRAARPLAFRLHARPMQALARRHGLPHAGVELRHVYTDGDLTLYADSPALVATYGRPSTHRYLGLIDWAPSAPLPSWWDALQAGARPIYVTLGSSGDVAKLPRVLAGLARLGCPVVVATAGAGIPVSLPAHVHLADYLPGDVVARRSCLVVCNGGSPTSHQALLAGVPVLGIPDNLDQVLNMSYLKGAGVGDWLATRDVTTDGIERLARRLLADPQLAARAASLGAAEKNKDITGTLEQAISELCSAQEGMAARGAHEHGKVLGRTCTAVQPTQPIARRERDRLRPHGAFHRRDRPDRDRARAQATRRAALCPTYTAFVAKAVALALLEFPYANRRLFRPLWFPFLSYFQSFRGTDIAVAIERNIEGQAAVAYIEVLRDVHGQTLEELTEQLRAFSSTDVTNSRQWRDFSRLATSFPGRSLRSSSVCPATSLRCGNVPGRFGAHQLTGKVRRPWRRRRVDASARRDIRAGTEEGPRSQRRGRRGDGLHFRDELGPPRYGRRPGGPLLRSHLGPLAGSGRAHGRSRSPAH